MVGECVIRLRRRCLDLSCWSSQARRIAKPTTFRAWRRRSSVMQGMFATAGSAKPVYAVLSGLQQPDRFNHKKRSCSPTCPPVGFVRVSDWASALRGCFPFWGIQDARRADALPLAYQSSTSIRLLKSSVHSTWRSTGSESLASICL